MRRINFKIEYEIAKQRKWQEDDNDEATKERKCSLIIFINKYKFFFL